MAVLIRILDDALFPVPAQCLVGRSASCTLRVDDGYASSEHAKIVWTGSAWTIRDLGSRNGTFVDGQRLQPGQPHRIANGSALGFGDTNAAWKMSDDTPPGAIAVDAETQQVVAAVGDILVLPDENAPELTVYPAPDGVGWVYETTDGEVAPVRDHGVIRTEQRSFRLELPVVSEATPMVDMSLTLDTVDFRFAVSRDEERVEISMIVRGIATELEPREHGYLLLTLARARQEDAALPVDERGWRTIPDLSRMLRLDSNALNVAIHRARQQLGTAGLEGAAGIVGVKRGTRRLGTDRFEITTLPDE